MKQSNLFSLVEADTDWHPSAPPSLDGVDEVCLDVESTGLRWWREDRPVGIGVGFKRDGKIITQYLPFAHRGGGNLDESVVKRWAQRELRDKRLINLHSKFDNHMMFQWGVDLEEQNCTWSDIAHCVGLLNDRRKSGFSLDAISRELVGEGKVKDIEGEHIADYHAGHVDKYGQQDVRLPIMCMDVLRPQLQAKGLLKVAALEDSVIFAVCEMERNGAPIDVEKLHAWIKKADLELAQVLKKLYDLVGFRVDPKNTEDLIRLFRLRGISIKHFTPNGQPSFTDEILASIQDEAIALVRYARRLMSLDSKYLRNYAKDLRGGNILRYALNQLKGDEGGTISGRFSSSALVSREDKEGVNIQQVMRPDRHVEIFGDNYIIRELYVPESGLWFCSDAEQIEYRLFAHYSRSERLRQAYKENPRTDFHNVVWEILKQFDPKITRKSTKDTNFAKIYGAQVHKISLMLKLSHARAQEFVNIYDDQFPETNRLIQEVQKLAEERGYVKTIMGRRFYFPDGMFLHKALSRVIQGTAADIMKTKLKELHEARKKTGFKMRFTVHDEVNGDVPDKRSAQMVEEILNHQSFNFRVPILWGTGTGANWKEAKAA